eukprot:UN00945
MIQQLPDTSYHDFFWGSVFQLDHYSFGRVIDDFIGAELILINVQLKSAIIRELLFRASIQNINTTKQYERLIKCVTSWILISGINHSEYISSVIGTRFFRWDLNNEKRTVIANIFRNYSINSRWNIRTISDIDINTSMLSLSEYAIWSKNELLIDILIHNFGVNRCRIKWMKKQIKTVNERECSMNAYRLYKQIWRHRYRYAPPLVTQNKRIMCRLM